ARAVAEAEAKAKAEQAEKERLAAAKAEEERKARAAAEAEAKRKADQAEQERLAAVKAEAERKANAVPAASQSQTPTSQGNPNALGVSRVVEIDTTGGPGFGSEHFKGHDILRAGEVVLTFDDGPWPKNTPAVLAALAAHCTKAIFFPIGLHAALEPQILKQVAAAGHVIGSHPWGHQGPSKTTGPCLAHKAKVPVEYDPKEEIEKGISAVRWAIGGPTAPYFRFPALIQPPELVTYLGQRNIAIFSADIDSRDFKLRKPEEVVQSVLEQLKERGKGMVILHDFQHATAMAVVTILDQLKTNGYKIVHMVPKYQVQTLARYDALIANELK